MRTNSFGLDCRRENQVSQLEHRDLFYYYEKSLEGNGGTDSMKFACT
jgi:hypothetical protein